MGLPFLALRYKSLAFIALALSVDMFFFATMYGSVAASVTAFFSKLFGTRVRDKRPLSDSLRDIL
jgi:hypothetical protein